MAVEEKKFRQVKADGNSGRVPSCVSDSCSKNGRV